MSEDAVQSLARDPRDQQRWLAFYQKLWPGVYYSVYRACRGERALAEDLTQDAFVRFLRYARLENFQNDAHALAYLRQIARNGLLGYLRRNRIERFSSDALLEKMAGPAAEDPEGVEARADLETLSAGLDDADQALLNRLLVGDSVQVIAEKSHVSYGTAAVRVHRLLRKLRLNINSLQNSR